MGFFNKIKQLFMSTDREVTIINSDPSLRLTLTIPASVTSLHHYLAKAVEEGSVPNYNGISKFLNSFDTDPSLKPIELDDITYHPSIKELVTKWVILKYRCTDDDLNNLIFRLFAEKNSYN